MSLSSTVAIGYPHLSYVVSVTSSHPHVNENSLLIADGMNSNIHYPPAKKKKEEKKESCKSRIKIGFVINQTEFWGGDRHILGMHHRDW
ncbi:MAG: hypothetical protein ACOXZ4_05710 [Sphaerochaetaceae bacterium]